jgi:hypothetical protein
LDNSIRNLEEKNFQYYDIMNETIVYVTGSPGFKSAVIAQLASEWIYSGPNMSRGAGSFTLPDAVPLEQFKATIGTKTLSDRNLLFFSEVRIDHPQKQVEFLSEESHEKNIDMPRNPKSRPGEKASAGKASKK